MWLEDGWTLGGSIQSSGLASSSISLSVPCHTTITLTTTDLSIATYDMQGEIEFAVNQVDEANGDISGVFVSKQPGDTDMGGKKPKTILSKGIFFAHIE